MGLYGDLMNGDKEEVIASKPESKLASKQASKLAPKQDATLEKIRLLVKEIGDAPGGYRFLKEEKERLADTVYALRKAGIRTDQNAIVRFAVNFIMEDFELNGESSVLQKFLELLKS